MRFLSLSPVCLALFLASATCAEPLQVLLLDYHAPIEHDVLQSYLCVEPCTASRGCPDELVKAGVDAYSDDFIVYRPRYMGQNASFVVDIYKERRIDLLSISGHHASGFSGERRRGRFETEQLSRDMPGVDNAAVFFTHPTLVMLQGCRTDVKSSFAGDPLEYVLHVVEDTQVRDAQFDRLLAAVQQLGGVQEAYRQLFPNACILGYSGTQTPGGLLEIYGQMSSWLRGLLDLQNGELPAPLAKHNLAAAQRTRQGLEDTARRIDKECPRGWPCNLCAQDPATYEPLRQALVKWLNEERHRVHVARRSPDASRSAALEASFEGSSFYENTRWSCSVQAPGTVPVWPEPVDESPFGRLFVELLLMEHPSFTPSERRELRGELVHRLGAITFGELDQIELRAWLHGPENWQHFWDFITRSLYDLSTFRQRDLFSFLAAISCGDCFEKVFLEGLPSILRENAASQLRPSVGERAYRFALADRDPRVRRAAAERLTSDVGAAALRDALQHADPEVRRIAALRVGEDEVLEGEEDLASGSR